MTAALDFIKSQEKTQRKKAVISSGLADTRWGNETCMLRAVW